jgi:hypothetical protein
MKQLIALVVACLSTSACAGLISRYSFTGDAEDSRSHRRAELKGTAVVADGKLSLDGAGWAELPGGLVTPLTSATVEAWFTYQNNGSYVRVFDFGNTNAKGLGARCWYFSPQCPKAARTVFSNTDPGYTYEETIDFTTLPENTAIHVVVVYYDPPRKARLYLNDRLIGERDMTIKLADIGAEHLYLGKSSYNSDKLLKGTIDEFRVYNDPMTDLQRRLNHQLGPDRYQDCTLGSMSPAPDANQVSTTCVLKWGTNRKRVVDHYEVALGTDAQALSPAAKTPPVFTSTKEPLLTPSPLAGGTTYYWRVDAIIDNQRHVGPVVSFTTVPAQ